MKRRGANRLALALQTSSRHPEAFLAVYDALARRLLRYFAQHAEKGQVPLDLTADTFAKAFEHRRDFDGRTDEQAASWLWSIARSELAMHWRHRRVELDGARRIGLERPFADDEELAHIEGLATIEQAAERVEVLYRELPEDQRQVIQMHVIDELGYQEIAERLGVSVEVARSRVSRGLRALAERIHASGLDSDLSEGP